MKEKQFYAKRLAKASITVEACMVMPVVLLVVFTLLSLIFYVHHRAWQMAVTGEVAITAGTGAVNKGVDVESLMRTKIAAVDGQGIEYSYQDSVVEVIAEKEMSFLMSKKRYALRTQTKMKVVRPVTFIRNVQAAEIIMED